MTPNAQVFSRTQPPSYNPHSAGAQGTQTPAVAASQISPERSNPEGEQGPQIPSDVVPNEDVVLTWNDGHEILGHSAAVEAHLTAQLHTSSHHQPGAGPSGQASGNPADAELPPE